MRTDAFMHMNLSKKIIFGNDSELRRVDSEAVETLAERCKTLEDVIFFDDSEHRRIGEKAVSGSGAEIQAPVETIFGSY